MSRYYCGRYGIAVTDDEGPICPECHRAWDKHREIRTDQCGYFARCPHGDHGHHCDLAPGHTGAHRGPAHDTEGA